MEAGTTLEMTPTLSKDLDRRIHVEKLVTNDDSSIRFHLRHTTNGGKLEADLPQSKFLTDPSHRIKTMYSTIYKMAINTKDPNKRKKIYHLRVNKYTSCYLY